MSFAPWSLSLLALLVPWSIAADAAEAVSEHYTRADFSRVEKIDAHVHLHGKAEAFMRQALLDRMRVLTINVDYPDFPPIADQQRDAVSLKARYPGSVEFAATFSLENFQSPAWSREALTQIDGALSQGAVGVKIWKNIGMSLQDPDGRYVMPDDRRFEPLFAKLESAHIVLLGHQAEPLNCWLPFERMTVRSDREYFRDHPQYYMNRHPEMPSHDTILTARDRLLRAHPALRFDAVHLASLEWDVDKIADFLDRFPNANVDLAARLVHLEYQAVQHHDRVRHFLMRYQDRILYGSDDAYGPSDSDAQALADVHQGWAADWRFLVTDDRLHSAEFAGSFQGMHLPRSVIDRIYRHNAESMFHGWTSHPR